MSDPADRAAFIRHVTRLWAERRHQEAAALARQRLAEQPEDGAAHQALCHSLAAIGRTDDAVHAGRRAVELDPTSLGARHVLAEALTLGARLDEALAIYDDALALRPHDAATAGLKASVLLMCRRYDESRALLEPHLATPAPDARVVIAFADLAPAIRETPRALELLRALRGRSDVHPAHMSQAMFRLGRLLDRDQDHDGAFEAYTRANEVVSTPYRHAERSALTDDLIHAWTAQTMRKAARFGSPSDQPVLIVKMPRSGSTLVDQILACHPQVGAAGERGVFGQVAASLGLVDGARSQLTARIRALSRADVERACRVALTELKKSADGDHLRLTDCSLNNDRHAGLFATLFPRGRIIICLRHAWDTCLSCYFQDFTGQLPWSFRLEDIARYRCDHERLLRHWIATLTVPIHLVHYEMLVSQPEQEVRRMLDFLHLPWDDRCMAFHESRRIAVSSSNQQVMQPIHSGSRHRYRHYEHHIEVLRRILPQPEFQP